MLTRGQSKHGEQTAIEEFELFIRRAEESRVAASWLVISGGGRESPA